MFKVKGSKVVILTRKFASFPHKKDIYKIKGKRKIDHY